MLYPQSILNAGPEKELWYLRYDGPKLKRGRNEKMTGPETNDTT